MMNNMKMNVFWRESNTGKPSYSRKTGQGLPMLYDLEDPSERLLMGNQPREYPYQDMIAQTELPGATRLRLHTVVPDYKLWDIPSLDYGYQIPSDYNKFLLLVSAIQRKSVQDIEAVLEEKVELEDLIDYSSMTTVLHIAARYGTEEVWAALVKEPLIRHLVNVVDERGVSPLIAACWYNNLSSVQNLTMLGAQLELHTKDMRKTALHCAADLPSDNITKLLLKINKKKFFIDAQDYEGNTALMVAVNTDSPSITHLIRAKSDYTKKNLATGRNILHMAIINNNLPLIEFLWTTCLEREFLDALDLNGDTPLMLAIRLNNDKAAEILFNSKNIADIISRSLQMLHVLVQKEKINFIQDVLNIIEDRTIFNVTDSRGRTVLMQAIYTGQTALVELLLNAGVDYKVRNYKTGENVLHAASYANKKVILNILFSLSDINELINETNYEGVTPFDIVLGYGGRDVWRDFIETGMIEQTYRNFDGETPLFIAAKKGNIYLAMSLLLSEKFNSHFESISMVLDKEELFFLELQGLIFASDVYILSGEDVGKRGWPLSPDQAHLFRHNYVGHNIFHACSLGENVELLSLIYNYCLKFNDRHRDLDGPDHSGNTPLMLALQCGSKPLARFYLKNNCNLAKKNKLKVMPLHLLNSNLYYWKPIILSVLKDCVKVEYDVKKKDKMYGELAVDFHLFYPKHYPQMYVISNMFETLKGEDGIDILKNPVIEYFVKSKWENVIHMKESRLLFSSLQVVFLSTYLIFLLCPFLGLDKFLFRILEGILVVLSLILMLWKIPLLFMKKYKNCIFLSISPLLTIYFVFAKYLTRTELEFAAAAVLFGWFTLLLTGNVSKIAVQIEQYFQVLKTILFQLPICLLLLLGFSNCFFVLYHNFIQFNNPIHAFLTTGAFLILGENLLPSFKKEIEPYHGRNHYFESYDKHNEILDGGKEIRGLLIEGTILMMFDIIVIVSVVNMLIGLVVASGEKLKEEGDVRMMHSYVTDLSRWEMLVESKFYTLISRLKLCFLFGTTPKLKELLKTGVVMRPMSDNKSVLFNVRKFYEDADSKHVEDSKYVVRFPDFRTFYLFEKLGKEIKLKRAYSLVSESEQLLGWTYSKPDLI